MKILKVLLVIVLLGVLGAGLLTAYEELPPPKEPVLLLPTFGEAPDLSVNGFEDYSSRFKAVADAGLAAGATPEQILEAVLQLQNRLLHILYGALSDGKVLRRRIRRYPTTVGGYGRFQPLF